MAFDFVNNYPFQIFKLLNKTNNHPFQIFKIFQNQRTTSSKTLKNRQFSGKEDRKQWVSLGQMFAFFDLENIIFTHTHTHTHTHKGFFRKKIGPDFVIIPKFLYFNIYSIARFD